jgi:hypothetical protein
MKGVRRFLLFRALMQVGLFNWAGDNGTFKLLPLLDLHLD